jgi:hypothetical protein
MNQAFKILKEENFEVSKVDKTSLLVDHGNGKTEVLYFSRCGIDTEWYKNDEVLGNSSFSDIWEYVAQR